MVKSPSSSIKAILKGCKVELLFGLDKKNAPYIFHIGVRIYDDPIHYLMISSVHRYRDEHFSIAKIMHLQKVQIQFYNELCTCQLFGDLVLNPYDQNAVLSLLGNLKKLYQGLATPSIHQSMDDFQYSFTNEINQHNTMEIISAITSITSMETVRNSFIGEEAITTNISDTKEGALFENEIYVVLRSLFDSAAYCNPQISEKHKKREFIDIFAYSEFALYLIEAKAIGINNTSDSRTMQRKVSGLQKQIQKGIHQLVGAYKRIKENQTIFTVDGRVISYNRDLLPYGIILVSELFAFEYWDETLSLVIHTIATENMMLLIMDIKEFM